MVIVLYLIGILALSYAAEDLIILTWAALWAATPLWNILAVVGLTTLGLTFIFGYWEE